MPLYEVTYKATAICTTRVHALSEQDAANMVRTGEAGDVQSDLVRYGRKVKAVFPADFITNRDLGDES